MSGTGPINHSDNFSSTVSEYSEWDLRNRFLLSFDGDGRFPVRRCGCCFVVGVPFLSAGTLTLIKVALGQSGAKPHWDMPMQAKEILDFPSLTGKFSRQFKEGLYVDQGRHKSTGHTLAIKKEQLYR